MKLLELLNGEGSDALSRLLFFEARHAVRPQELAGWPKLASQLEELLAVEDDKSLGSSLFNSLVRLTGVMRVALLVALDRSAEVDEALRRLEARKPATSFDQRAWPWLYSLRGRSAARRGDFDAAVEQHVLAVLSAIETDRDDLFGLFLTDLGVSLAKSRRHEAGCAVLESARVGWEPLVPGLWASSHSRGGSLVTGKLHADWAARELAHLGCADLPDGNQLRAHFTNHVVALEWMDSGQGGGSWFVALAHREGLSAMPVLLGDRDDLAPGLDWLRPDFRCCPSLWAEAVAILGLVTGGRDELSHLLHGVHLLVDGSEDDLADLDKELRRMLGDGPARLEARTLRKKAFLDAWEPWLTERGLVGN